MITEQEKNKIISGEEIEISSSRALIQQFFVLLSIPGFLYFFYILVSKELSTWRGGDYIAIIVSIVFFLFNILMFKRLSVTKIKGDKIFLKKIIGKEEEYLLSDIEDIEGFRIQFSTYLSILINTEYGQKRFWVLKPSILSGGTNVYDLLYDAKFLSSVSAKSGERDFQKNETT